MNREEKIEQKIEKLSAKAIRLQKQVLKINDQVMELDECAGEELCENLSDESFLRG